MTNRHMMKTGAVIMAAAAMLAGCDGNSDWPVVDGASPEVHLESLHLRTEPGRTVRMSGEITDADGIAEIKLVCHDLYLNKTINLLEIKDELLTRYELDFAWAINERVSGDAFEVEITVTDVLGNASADKVMVTLDADFTAPVFTAAPDKEITVLIKEKTQLNLKFSVTDNIAIDHVVVDIEGVEGFPMRIEGNGERTVEFARKLTVPSEAATYKVTIEAFDPAAQDDEVRSTRIESTVNVSELPDFEKMYLADVKTAAELNSDVFGVPMLIEHTGPYEYTARYYNAEAGTEICFIPQKTDFTPICFGPETDNNDKLGDDPESVGRIKLTQGGVYYKIDYNTRSGEYDVNTCGVDEAIDPVMHMHYGQNDLDTWWDGGSWWQEWYIGPGSDHGSVVRMEQDRTNPHLFRLNQWQLEAGSMNWTIMNWHSNGWWNFQAWRVDNSQDPEKMMYYGNYTSGTDHYESNKDYFDYKYGDVEGFSVDSWSDESYRKQFVPDNWVNANVSQAGKYLLEFDAHLERVKLVPAE